MVGRGYAAGVKRFSREQAADSMGSVGGEFVCA